MRSLSSFSGLSWSEVVSKLEAPQNPYSAAAPTELDKSKPIWSNSDLDPTPPSSRTWTWVHYTSFWLASSFATGTWTTGSAMIALGMPWYAAWLAVVISHVIGAVLLVANGRGPAAYHIGFPVYARASFGLWGSYFAIVSRCIVAAICNAGTTTQLLGAMAIFWVLSMPFVFIHPKNLNWYFVAKSCMVGPACFAVLIWAVVLNGGSVGPSFQTAPKLADPTYYGWLWMSALNSGFGGCSALIVAQADIARWARRPSDQTWSQLITYPVFSALPALFGILVASATSNFWGKQYWNLWDVLSAALDYYDMSPASRGLVFLASFAFAVAILGTNVAANSLPFGSDIAGLLPRWISIRRGQVLCSLLVFPIVPWKIISSAKSLLTFLSGYSILMGPFASICIVDYFFIRNGNLRVPDLYVGDANSQYWYTKGWNLRMAVAWILGVMLPFPGFVASFGTTSVGDGANHMWNMGYLLSIVVSGAVYYVLFWIFPDPSIDKSLAFEQLAAQYDDGLIDGQAVGQDFLRNEASQAEKGKIETDAKSL
ncbi:hypothetical protein E8E14_001972 [Neopestalotiopsis sp. 37M]|nr:hypothetical protein E8E14_001972 [Neopestalotiopsis sp. 37M]